AAQKPGFSEKPGFWAADSRVAAGGREQAISASPPAARHSPLTFPGSFEREVTALHDALGGGAEPFLVRRLLLDVGGYTEARLSAQHGGLGALVKEARARLAQAGCPVPAAQARARYGGTRRAAAGRVSRSVKRPATWTDRLARVLTHRLWGTLIFLATMFVVFQAIFTWARPLMKLIGAGKDWLADLLRGTL